jgi:hypothetical protein
MFTNVDNISLFWKSWVCVRYQEALLNLSRRQQNSETTVISVYSTCRLVVSFALGPLYSLERVPGAQWVGSCVGPRAGLDAVAKRSYPIITPSGNRTKIEFTRQCSA